MRIAECESSLNPSAVSPDGQNLGLFQVNVIHRAKVNGPVERLLEPEENVRVAYLIWSDQGWKPWSCR